MDHKKSIHELKEEVRSFCEARDWDQFHGPKELAIGVVTESAELLEHFRFKTDAQMKEMLADPAKRAEIGEEMADVLFFLLRLSQMYGFNLASELSKKIEKNDQKYPVSSFKGSNRKYTEHKK